MGDKRERVNERKERGRESGRVNERKERGRERERERGCFR